MSIESNAEQRRKAYLRAMGIELFQVRNDLFQLAPQVRDVEVRDVTQEPDVAVPIPDPVDVVVSPVPVSPVADYGWERLRATVADCRACTLAESRTQTVFGVGSQNADWMLVGEAPGADEDRQGEPFAGKAGQLLTSMLHAAGLARQDVYITNIIKCSPPDNRDPRPDEVSHCITYLERQIELVQPRVIIAVGRIAAHSLLQVETQVGRLRGTTHHFGAANIPLLVTYHPAYLLRSPSEKRKSWQDMCRAQRLTSNSTLV